MTIVIAARTLIDITIIADTRVSYEGKRFVENQGILKLLSMSFSGTPFTITLGFSGYLEPVNEVLSYLIDKKLWHYKRRLVMSYLGSEMKQWIEEFVPKLSVRNQQYFRQSEILLCGFEIFRRQRNHIGAEPVFSLPPPGYVYSYKLKENGQVELREHHNICVIGEGKKERPLLEYFAAQSLLGHPRKMSPPDFLDSYVLCSDTLRLFQERKLISVGGAFQCVQLTPYFPSRHFFVGENIPYEVEQISTEKIEIKYPNTGDKYRLLSLRSWIAKNGAQGQLG